MLELIQKIKTYTEAGIILEHMELFDEVELIAKFLNHHIDLDKNVIMVCPKCGLIKTFHNGLHGGYCGPCSFSGEERVKMIIVGNREA